MSGFTSCSLARPPTPRGVSCARTLAAALEDTQLRPSVVHVVGAADAELEMDWAVLRPLLADSFAASSLLQHARYPRGVSPGSLACG